MHKKYPILLIVVLLLFFTPQDLFSDEEIRYVPIGDSYTIGTGASSLNESWPMVLTAHLQAQGIPIRLIANTAMPGYRTEEILVRELPVFRSLLPDFSTLLIGVNDWVWGLKADDFRIRFRMILEDMLEILPRKENLLVMTIPDFSFTPRAQEFSSGRDIAQGLEEFNTIIKEEAGKRGVVVFDLYNHSKKMANDPALISKDGLHPSAKGYALWETWIYPYVENLIKNRKE